MKSSKNFITYAHLVLFYIYIRLPICIGSSIKITGIWENKMFWRKRKRKKLLYSDIFINIKYIN